MALTRHYKDPAAGDKAMNLTKNAAGDFRPAVNMIKSQLYKRNLHIDLSHWPYLGSWRVGIRR
jgi:hypothetical protein